MGVFQAGAVKFASFIAKSLKSLIAIDALALRKDTEIALLSTVTVYFTSKQA